jgi:hypothetical protein
MLLLDCYLLLLLLLQATPFPQLSNLLLSQVQVELSAERQVPQAKLHAFVDNHYSGWTDADAVCRAPVQ